VSMNFSRNALSLFSLALFCTVIASSAQENATEETSPSDAATGESSASTGVTSIYSQPIVQSSASETPMVRLEDNQSNKSHLIGIGLDFGFHIFFPEHINSFLDSLWTVMKDDLTSGGMYIIQETGTPSMFLGFALGGHVAIRPIPYLAMSIVGKMTTAPKALSAGTASLTNPDVSVTARDRLVGCGITGYLMPDRTVTLKGGINVEYHWVSLEVEQKNIVTKSGSAFGCMPFAGLAIAPGKGHVIINIDLTVPICSVDLTETKGNFRPEDTYFISIGGTPRVPLPKKVVFTGFEIKPAITICFP
jgi:hypothetical protein